MFVRAAGVRCGVCRCLAVLSNAARREHERRRAFLRVPAALVHRLKTPALMNGKESARRSVLVGYIPTAACVIKPAETPRSCLDRSVSRLPHGHAHGGTSVPESCLAVWGLQSS